MRSKLQRIESDVKQGPLTHDRPTDNNDPRVPDIPVPRLVFGRTKETSAPLLMTEHGHEVPRFRAKHLACQFVQVAEQGDGTNMPNPTKAPKAARNYYHH